MKSTLWVSVLKYIKDSLYLLLIFLLILAAGCSSNPEGSSAEIAENTDFAVINSDDFMRDYKELTEVLSNEIEQAFLEILTKSTSRETHKNVIRMRNFVTNKIRTLEDSDPGLATINTWAFVRRFNMYASTGEGRFLFGKSQSILTGMLTELDKKFEKFTLNYLKKEDLEDLSKKINDYVLKSPIEDVFKAKTEEEQGTFSRVMNPLNPFRAIDAVSKGGQGIENIAKTAERFTDIVEDLPEDIRWQLQVLTLQLQDNKILKENTETLTSLANSFDKMNDLIAKYPEMWREERKHLAKEINAILSRLDGISKDIEKSTLNVKTSSENFSQLGKDINQSTEKITSSMKQVEESSQALSKAAGAVSQTIKDIQHISEFFAGDPNDKKEPKGPDEKPFLKQVELSAIALEKTAQELNKAIGQIQSIVEDKPFSEDLIAVDKISQKAIDLTRKEAEILVDYIFIRSLILLGVAFVLSMILLKFRKKKAVKIQ